MKMQMPTRPLQTIITTANTVSRASAGTSLSPSMMVAISATSMMVTDSVNSSVPKGSPIRCAITSAWWTPANNRTANAGNIHADLGIGPCALMCWKPFDPARRLCATTWPPSAFYRMNEPPRRIDRAEIIQVLVPAAGKPHELLRLMGEREQAFSEAARNSRIVGAMHDEKRHGDARDALVRVKLIAHQETDRHDPKQRAGDVHGRCIGRFQDQFSDWMFRRHGDRDAGAERKAPDHDPGGIIAGGCEGVGCRRILQQSALARMPARPGIAAIGQCHETGPVGGHPFEAADAACEKVAIAGEKQDHRPTGLRRHMPDNDLLAIRGGQDVLLGFRKTGGARRRAPDRRNRKQHLALLEEQHGKAAALDQQDDKQKPFQDDHDSAARS